MAKKLTPDYIELVAKFNATEAQHEINKLTEATKALQEEKKNLKKVQQELASQGKKNTDEYKNLTNALKKCTTEINNNKKKVDALEGKLDKASMSTAQLEKKQKALKQTLRDTVKSLNPEEYARLEKELGAVQRQIKKNNSSLKTFKNTLLDFDKARAFIAVSFISFGQSLATSFLNVLRSIPQVLKDFEYSNASLASVLGKSRKEITLLTDDAKRLGQATSYSASEVTNLQIELAKLGFAQQEILYMTESVLLFASATGADLPKAAALSGAALRAFNLEASEAGRVTSAMAVATTKSALDFSYLETSMSTVSPVAKAFGFSIEETLSLLGTLANSGFDASTAATATRNIILKLSDSSGELAKSLGGPIKSLDDLSPALRKLKDEGIDLSKALELTDVRSVAAFNTFIEGSDSLMELKYSVTDVSDLLKEMSDERMNTLEGSGKRLQSVVEGVILKFEWLKEVLKFFIDAISSTIEFVQKFNSAFLSLVGGIVTYIAVKKATIVLQKLSDKATQAETASKSANTIATTANTAATTANTAAKTANNAATTSSISLKKVYTGVTIMAKNAMKSFTAVMRTNKFAIIAAAIMTVVYALYSFISNMKKAKTIQEEIADIDKQVKEETRKERSEILSLTSIINNNNISLNERLKAIKKLKEIIPGYTAEISKEGKVMNQNTEALKNYLRYIREAKKREKLQEKLAPLIDEEDALDEEYDKKIESGNYGRVAQHFVSNKGVLSTTYRDKTRDELDWEYDQKKKEITDQQDVITKEFEASLKKTPDMSVPKSEIGSLIKDLEERIKKVQNEWKETTEEEIRVKNIELDRLNKKLQRLKNLGLNKESKEDIEARKKREAEEAERAKDKADKDALKVAQDKKDASLSSLEDTMNKEKKNYEKQYAEGVISKERYNVLMANLSAQEGETRLQIAKQYLDDINKTELNNAELKKEVAASASKEVIKQELEAMRERARLAEALRDTAFDFKKEFKLVTPEEEKNLELTALQAFYDAKLQIIKDGLKQQLISQVEAAEKEKELQELLKQAKLNIEKDYQSKRFSVLDKYGLVGFKEHLSAEMDELKKHRENGTISEEEYNKAVGTIRFTAWTKQFQQYAEIFSNAVNSLRDAEIANMEAKYDAEIQNAEGNAERVEQLEQEKAEKKLEIEKKYADVQFAIKAAQIASNTALAIIETHASLGGWTPWAIAAAALMGITGAAQIAVANSEREKVKNMRLSGSSKSNSRMTGERVVNNSSGYSEGGYTGDGERLEVAGAVHRGEYVVPMPEMKDRRVINMVKAIESIRRQRTSLNPLPGYSEGGYVSGKTKIMDSTTNNGSNDLTQAATALRTAASTLTEKPIRTYVLLSDVNSAYDLKNRSEQPFTRGK